MLGQKDHNLHFHAVAVHDKTIFLEMAPLSSRRASTANPYHQRPEVAWDLRGLILQKNEIPSSHSLLRLLTALIRSSLYDRESKKRVGCTS